MDVYGNEITTGDVIAYGVGDGAVMVTEVVTKVGAKGVPLGGVSHTVLVVVDAECVDGVWEPMYGGNQYGYIMPLGSRFVVVGRSRSRTGGTLGFVLELGEEVL